ncbi:MAG TPA: undecaprenyl diphosphate synthase family protein [Lacipirellulaceae bacterium]|nr:undecaprenyl diphosphate synthase family protein [Lacipirellulaceae bacterium]
MKTRQFTNVPRHIGIIPDGNRRWAEARGLPRHAGYDYGLAPALELVEACTELGVGELTFYGFTQDNTKRAAVQREAFQRACVEAVRLLGERDAAVLVVGNTHSPMFPSELLPSTGRRRRFGRGSIKVNLLVNYSWQWDLSHALMSSAARPLSLNDRHLSSLGSAAISRIDLVLRWGGRRRLSGFLPIQTVYSDFYILDELWPDYDHAHLDDALAWYQLQDVTLGG